MLPDLSHTKPAVCVHFQPLGNIGTGIAPVDEFDSTPTSSISFRCVNVTSLEPSSKETYIKNIDYLPDIISRTPTEVQVTLAIVVQCVSIHTDFVQSLNTRMIASSLCWGTECQPGGRKFNWPSCTDLWNRGSGGVTPGVTSSRTVAPANCPCTTSPDDGRTTARVSRRDMRRVDDTIRERFDSVASILPYGRTGRLKQGQNFKFWAYRSGQKQREINNGPATRVPGRPKTPIT